MLILYHVCLSDLSCAWPVLGAESINHLVQSSFTSPQQLGCWFTCSGAVSVRGKLGADTYFVTKRPGGKQARIVSCVSYVSLFLVLFLLVPGAQDSSYIWWKSLVLSFFVSVLVVSASVLVTYKAARWRRAVSLEKGNDEAEQKSESEERKGQDSPRSRRSSPSNQGAVTADPPRPSQ